CSPRCTSLPSPFANAAAFVAGRLDAIEATVSHKSPDDRAILLLYESLIILLVGARACHLDFSRATPGHHDVVHERAVIVEIGAANDPGKQVLRALHRSHDEAALARHQRHTLGPTSRDIDHRQRLNERASYRWATMSTAQNPGGGSCQSLNVRIGTSRRTAE